MAAPTFVNVTSDSASVDADRDLSAAAPSGTGGLLIMVGAITTSATFDTKPSGLSTFQTVTQGAGFQADLWGKADDAAGSYAFHTSGGFTAPSVAVARITGGDFANIISAQADNSAGSDDTVECPNITTLSADNLVLMIVVSGYSEDSTTPGGWTEELDITGSAGGAVGSHIAIYSKAVAATGLVSGPVITKSGFSRWVAFAVAIPPSGGGGGGTTAPPPRRRPTRFFNRR